MCPWTVMCKLQTIQQQIVTVVWSDLDVQNGFNSILCICKLKFNTFSNPIHGFVERTSFVGFTGGPQQSIVVEMLLRGKTQCFEYLYKWQCKTLAFRIQFHCTVKISSAWILELPLGVQGCGERCDWSPVCPKSHLRSGSWPGDTSNVHSSHPQQRGSWLGM